MRCRDECEGRNSDVFLGMKSVVKCNLSHNAGKSQKMFNMASKIPFFGIGYGIEWVRCKC